MTFYETTLPDSFIVEMEPRVDDRGFFARSWCQREFSRKGLNPSLVQCNVSFNNRRGTLRGMHFQLPPYEEAKLVRCTMGAIFDVIIDLRPQSPTFKKQFTVQLDAKNHRMLYVPEGFAHGFQTLTDSTEVFYQMSEFFTPEAANSGIRWNDPVFGIQWPFRDPILSERDRNYPDF